ncbi:CIA30 family protein [Kordia zhangzhouensis]|uniref:hypothetical protein n=1 Tax=Kordia zhangzhouensis TaxID=1620405 RepID=UPI0007EE0323|nr:hypothetical protein [Kordia zhangzhouensis]
MKKIIQIKNIMLATIALAMSVSCERDISDDAVEATFPNTAEVFTDAPVGLTDEFFTSFDPASGANPNGFGTDEDEAFEGTTSIRIDVPSPNDPDGGYIGGIFKDRGEGRDLSGYDALTFWAKGSTTATIDLVGFGTDFEENKYAVGLPGITLSTDWRKYVIPIPDASKLTQEKGLFIFSAGTQSTNGLGYTFWIDEIRFENLGTIAQPRPAILNGNDETRQAFIGTNIALEGLTQTFNLASGQDVTVNAAPSYFEFQSSNTGVVTVDEAGNVNVIGANGFDAGGNPIFTTVTASLNGNMAAGSLTIDSQGEFTPAPTPTRDPSLVKSIFSDAYTNEPVEYYNGYYAPFQTTQGQNDITINGDNIIKYTQLNFVGIQFSQPTINASDMTHLHMDLYIEQPSPLDGGDFLRIELQDYGANGTFGGGDDSTHQLTYTIPTLFSDGWVSLDIPLASFTGVTSTANLGQLLFISDGTITDMLVDNIYLYQIPTSPTVAAPTPTDPAGNVISLFSDAYTDVNVDTWRTPWSAAATTFEDVTVAGNAAKKYGNLGFVGIETTTNTVDASSMTHFHIDVWSSTYTSFNIKLVDFGADNVFGGGDDTEHEVSINMPAQGEWVSLDIPLSDFTGLASTSNIAQYILVAQPFEATDVFIDNMYFRN